MRFALSNEQRQFAASLHDLLADGDTSTVARRWAAEEPAPGQKLWRRLADLGVTALAVPERWDGLGAAPADLVVAFEELGYFAVPGPLVESVAAVPILLTALADDELAARWLPGMAAGDAVASLALPPRVPCALDGDRADPVFLVDGDMLRRGLISGPPMSTVDPARRLFDLRADTDVLASGSAVQRAAALAFDHGALACAAQLLGLGRGLLDRTTNYATQRMQFGRPIGQFQAVKHQLADVLVALELARPLLYGAGLALAESSDTVGRDVSAAKVACADAAYEAARTALQVHGAIGYTREYDLSLWLTKVRALVSAWGTQSAHRARVMEGLCGSR